MSRKAEQKSRREPTGAPELRVIQGGRASSVETRESAERTHAGRSKLPGRVKRRRRITAAVLALLAGGLIVYVLLGPVTRVLESRRDVARVEAQLAEEQSRTVSLEERKARDTTDAFVQLEARKMGYVKPGEIPIIVLDYQEEEPPAESTSEDADGNAAENPAGNPSP